MTHLLFALASFPIGVVLGHLVACWCFSCRKIGHDWERFEIDGAHYRQATECFGVCKRCGHMEPTEEKR